MEVGALWNGGWLEVASSCLGRGAGGCRLLGCGERCEPMSMVGRRARIALLLQEREVGCEGWKEGWSLRRRWG